MGTYDSESRTTVTVQLIRIDLERRWKTDGHAPVGDPLQARPHVNDYVTVLTAFSDIEEVPIELLAFEFRIRHLWGDGPGIKDFTGQFVPKRRTALQDACEKVISNISMQASQNLPYEQNAGANEAIPTSKVGSDVNGAEKSFRSLSEGMQISHYSLQRQIGKGGFGVVFEAVNLDRPYQQCAIKLIRPDRVASPKLAERFKQEIATLTGLSHPNIACATDSGDWKGVPYLVLELIVGSPVSRLVRRNPGLTIADACEIVRQTAIGLQHIHEKNRTHRDIKPSNLMVTSDGGVKILDLGLARLLDIEDQEERLTSIGEVIGTPDYMAPEQWRDSSQVDIRGDIYSLGCTLYCVLVGHPPFAESGQFDPVVKMRAHSESPIPEITTQRGDVPEAVRHLITECMARKPKDRPAEPQDIADRLALFVAESKLSALNEQLNPPRTPPLIQAIDDPAFEATLIRHGPNLDETHAEQSIKPRGALSSAGKQSMGSAIRSYSASGSVVLTPRQVTYGKITDMDDAEYEIGDKLGEGGMGAVYRARQGSVDRGVALKMVKKNQGTTDAQDRFLAEAVVTGALEHPNIVPIYDLGVNTDDELFYAMKEVKGHAWTDSIDTVSLEENLEVIGKVSDAIAFSHEKGIVHRDLKPDNIMIGQFGEVVVMDWGLALPTDKFEKPGLPFTQGLAGTPSYMAPEMADLSLAPIGPAADIYLLGALLFRAVTKKAPHTGKHAHAALRAAAVNTIQWPDDGDDSYDDELLGVARKAMATRPEDRYASATDFKQALRDYRSHSESRRLTDSAIDELANAETRSSYRSFERSIAALEEAMKLWSDNLRAAETLQMARLRYGQAAFQKGDLDLAELQLDEADLAHTELLKSIREQRAEREAQAQRLRRLKRTAASLAAVVFLTVSVSAVMINSARNKEKAAKEQEAIAKTEAVQRFRESQSTIAELSQLADVLRDYPLAQAERQQLLKAVTDYYDRQTSKQSDVPELRIEQLRSLVRLGEVFNQLAEYSQAIKTWDRSAELAGVLEDDDTFGKEAAILHSQSLAGRTQSLLATGDHAAARTANEDAITRLAEIADDTDLMIDLAVLRLQQASIEKVEGRYTAALPLVDQAIESFQKLVESSSSDRARQQLGVSLGLRTQIQELTGNYTDAALSANRAVNQWKELTVEHPETVRYADGLATSQIDAANVLRVAGRDPLDDYEVAVATFQQLVELRPGIPRYRFNLATALSGLAWTRNRLAETESAQESAVESANTLLFLSERFPEDIRFPLGEVSARLVLAEILRDRGKFDLAAGVIKEASVRLSDENIPPESLQSRERFGELLLMFGQVQSAIGDTPLAMDSFQQSADAFLELAASEVGLPRQRDNAAWAMYYLGHELARSNDDEGSAAAIQSAIEIRNNLPKRAAWLDSFAWLLLTVPVESLRDASRAESVASSAVNLASESPRFIRTLALAQLKAGRLEPAAESLKKAEVLIETEHPEDQLLRAMLVFKQGDKDQAQQLYVAGTALMDAASPANPRLLMIRQEAATLLGVVVPVRKDEPDVPAELTN